MTKRSADELDGDGLAATGPAAPGSPAASSMASTTTARKLKRCKLCRSTPDTPNPLVAGHLFEKWGPEKMPWGSGGPDHPVGHYDAICLRTFQTGSFCAEFGTIQQYHAETQRRPEEHERFLQARSRWVELHNECPDSRLRKGAIMPPTEVVSEEKDEDALEAPEEEFIELATWQDENRLPNGDLPQPEQCGLKKVQVNFRGKLMWGVYVMTGQAGHYKLRKSSAKSVGKRTVEDDGTAKLEEGQTDEIHRAARSALLAKGTDAAVSVDQILQSLQRTRTADTPGSRTAEASGEADDEDDSAAEDAAADNAIETSSRFAASGGFRRPGEPTKVPVTPKAAPGKSGKSPASGSGSKAATKPSPLSVGRAMAASPGCTVASRPQGGHSASDAPPATASGLGPSGVAGVAVGGAGGGGSGRTTKAMSKFDLAAETKFADEQQVALTKLCDFGTYTEIGTSKGWQGFQKEEKNRQRDAQQLGSRLASKLRAKDFRIGAPDALAKKLSDMKDKADKIFKHSKAMSQASTTTPYDVEQNLSDIIDSGIPVPAQHVVHMLRFTFVDCIKFSKFQDLAAAFRLDTAWAKRMLDGGMTSDDVLEFYRAEFEDAATKLMRAVTIGEISDSTAGSGTPRARLVAFLSCVQAGADASITDEISLALALVQPHRASISDLSNALVEVAKDQPSPLLSPYTGCPPGKAFVANAMRSHEKREVERQIVDHTEAVRGLYLRMTSGGSNIEVVRCCSEIRALKLPSGVDLRAAPPALASDLRELLGKVDRWVSKNLLEPVVSDDMQALDKLCGALEQGTSFADKFSSKELAQMLKYGSEDQQHLLEGYSQIIGALCQVGDVVNGVINAPDGAAEELAKQSAAALQDLRNAMVKHGNFVAQGLNFSLPNNFVLMAKKSLGQYVQGDYKKAQEVFCKIVFESHLKDSGDEIKPAAHHANLLDMCSRASRLAAGCLDEAAQAAAEQHSEVLKDIVVADLMRRGLLAYKSKILSSKPPPLADAVVNVAIGKFNRAMAKLAETDKVKSSVAWCLDNLAASVDVDQQAAAAQLMLGKWKSLRGEINDKRSRDIWNTLQKEIDGLTAKLDAAPPYEGGSPEQEAIFIAYMGAEKMTDKMSKAETSLSSLKTALGQASLMDAGACPANAQRLQNLEKDVFPRGRALIAIFGALALLTNKLIAAPSTKGKALRSQLESINDIIAGDGLKVSTRLMERIAKCLKPA